MTNETKVTLNDIFEPFDDDEDDVMDVQERLRQLVISTAVRTPILLEPEFEDRPVCSWEPGETYKIIDIEPGKKARAVSGK